MADKDLLKRILIAKKKPDSVKDLTPSELADLVLMVFDQIKQVNTSLKKGTLTGKPGKDGFTPRPDKDYLSLKTARGEINRALKGVDRDVARRLKQLRNGKDGVVTDKEIQRAAKIASELIELPDARAVIASEPEAIRDALELLQGKERLSQSAVEGLEETLSDLAAHVETAREAAFQGVARVPFLSLRDVEGDGWEDGLVPAYNATTGKFEPANNAGGGSAWGDIAGTLADQTDLQTALDGKADSTHTHTATDITNLAEAIDDQVNSLLVAGTNITLTYNDATGTLTIDASGGGGSHDPVTVTDSSEINFTLTGQDLTASLIAGSIDVLKLDAGVQASLGLADSALQSGDNISVLTNDSGYITDYTVTEADVTAHQAALTITESQISDLGSYVETLADLGITATSTELNFVDGVTSAIQTQLNARLENIVEDTTPQLGGTLDAQNNTIDDAKSVVFNSEIDNGNSSTADTIDWTAGQKQKSTLTGNCTYTFTSPPGVGNFLLRLVQDATGSRTVTWPASVKWAGGTAPTLTTDANGIDIVSFYYDGTNYYGVASLAFA